MTNEHTPAAPDPLTLPAGPELDRVIAELVKGWTSDGCGWWGGTDSKDDRFGLPKWSKDAAAALKLLEESGIRRWNIGCDGFAYTVDIEFRKSPSDRGFLSVCHRSLPLAICRALLAAKGGV